MERREQRADGELDLFLGETGNVLGKGRYGIELGEENVDGKRDAERLGKLAKALVERLGQCANLFGGVGRQDALNADADDDGAGGQAAVRGESRT